MIRVFLRLKISDDTKGYLIKLCHEHLVGDFFLLLKTKKGYNAGHFLSGITNCVDILEHIKKAETAKAISKLKVSLVVFVSLDGSQRLS